MLKGLTQIVLHVNGVGIRLGWSIYLNSFERLLRMPYLQLQLNKFIFKNFYFETQVNETIKSY